MNQLQLHMYAHPSLTPYAFFTWNNISRSLSLLDTGRSLQLYIIQLYNHVLTNKCMRTILSHLVVSIRLMKLTIIYLFLPENINVNRSNSMFG